MRTVRRSVLTFVLALLVMSCAGVAPPPAPESAPDEALLLTRAATLYARGCYRCLLDAQALYEDLVQVAADPAAATAGLFRTSVLIGLRERELGLPDKGRFNRALDLAVGVTAPAEWLTFLEIAEATSWQTVGLRKSVVDENSATRMRAFRARDAWNAALGPFVPTDPLAAYLYLGLNCRGRWFVEQPPELADVLAAHDDALFVRYRRARCNGSLVELSSVQTLEPRFTEMQYFLGQLALRARNPALAEFHFEETYGTWPDWPAPALALGDLAFAAEDFQVSLRFYDDTLSLVADQRDGLLGKAKALSYLGRNREALPLLDRLVELGQWYMGDVYFWRAWNRLALDSVEPAREDIELAKGFRMDAEVFTLSGQIAIEQGRLQDARRELETALERNDAACDAAFHLGRVHVEETRWPETGQAFGHATQCYAEIRTQFEAALERLRRDPTVPEDRRTRLLPRHEARIATATRQAASSAYNAALGFYNDRQGTDARRYAEQASPHPDFTERATRLLGLIAGLP